MIKLKQKKEKKTYEKKIYYSFLSFVLIICLIQVARGAYLNIAKYITLHSKYNQLKELNEEAVAKNSELKQELKDYTSYKGVEELARNNLNMAGKDEVLVIIKPPIEVEKPSDKKWYIFWQK
ncbi:MAG: septum formation initiator family protein [Candidatus Gastranaerophilales bacterium]|nr:septum formation initiator family protein [Candidatus Gastranaerophilales bacterium]